MLEGLVLVELARAGRSLTPTTLADVSMLALAVGPAFVDNTTDFPGGAPNNLSDSERVDFGDGDGARRVAPPSRRSSSS